MMAFGGPRADSSRFGSERFSFSPRQADLMIVAGTVTYKMSWVVKKIWDQMPDPKWCIAMGVCTSTGGMFRSYPVVQGIDQFLPVDAYVSGCPPRPEALMNALMYIQDKVKQSHPPLLNLGTDSGDVTREELVQAL
jgi:NADH-quinone oxidoreductase subunit B